MREKLRWQDDFEIVEMEENLLAIARSSLGVFHIYRGVSSPGFVGVHLLPDGTRKALGEDRLISRVKAICQNIVDQSYTFSSAYSPERR